MKFFVIIKEKSERLPDKNFLELGGISLYKHLLNSLLVSNYEVFVDTDSDIVLKDLKANIAIGNSVHPRIILLHFFLIK